MKEKEDLGMAKYGFEFMKFPKLERIEGKDLSWAESIMHVFNIEPIEARQRHLAEARRKVWKVVKDIQVLNDRQKRKYLPKGFIMDPYNSALRFFIDTFIVTLILFDLVISPFKYLVYFNEATSYYREITFDAFFLMEIIANFFTGYYDLNEQLLITDMKLIAINYLKKGLFFDVVYTLPFWLILPELVVLRMIKMYRFPYIVSVIQQMIIFFSSYCFHHHFKLKIILREIFPFLFNVLYVLHVFSCIYIYIAKQYPINWVTGNGLDFDETLEVYVSSVHMLAQTFSTTGYGDLKPMNNAEMVFMIISQAVCCGLFTYLLTCILIVLISHLDTLSFKFKTPVSLYQWMKHYTSHFPASTNPHQLSNTFWDNVTNYFDVHYGTRNNFEWISLFPFVKEIKPNDRKRLMRCAFEATIEHFASFFNGLSESTQHEIVLHFKTHIQKAPCTALKENKKVKRVFFIEKGAIVVAKGEKLICQLKEGEVFGLQGLINPFSEFSYEIGIDADYAHLLSISLKELTSILSYDDKSYQCALSSAKAMRYSLKQMMGGESSDQLLIQPCLPDESMEVISNIPHYIEVKRRKEEDNEAASLNIEGLDLGNNEAIAAALNNAITKEKELIELELRLKCIEKQLNYINTNSILNNEVN